MIVCQACLWCALSCRLLDRALGFSISLSASIATGLSGLFSLDSLGFGSSLWSSLGLLLRLGRFLRFVTLFILDGSAGFLSFGVLLFGRCLALGGSGLWFGGSSCSSSIAIGIFVGPRSTLLAELFHDRTVFVAIAY